MNKKLWAKKIAKILDEYFPEPKVPLHFSDPFTLLVAVVLSAQCTDDRVNKITPTLFGKASTPKKMAKLPLRVIEEIIRPCGLYRSKAKAIKGFSQIIAEKHHGKVPDSFEELEELPGVGHKSASVVMSQGYNHPAVAVDTHVRRCAVRWGLSPSNNVKIVEENLKKLFPKDTWNKLHLQIIYFGREFCSARGHDPHLCPICQYLPNTPICQHLPNTKEKSNDQRRRRKD